VSLNPARRMTSALTVVRSDDPNQEKGQDDLRDLRLPRIAAAMAWHRGPRMMRTRCRWRRTRSPRSSASSAVGPDG
jgi:hypothetical protein